MTWETRDLPVLRAIVEATDDGNEYVEISELMNRTGLDSLHIQRALKALAGERPMLFEAKARATASSRTIYQVSDPTGHARRIVGTWPTPDAWAGRLIEGLEKAAESEPNDERRGKLRRAAEAVGGVGKDVIAEVIASVITKSSGLG